MGGVKNSQILQMSFINDPLEGGHWAAKQSRQEDDLNRMRETERETTHGGRTKIPPTGHAQMLGGASDSILYRLKLKIQIITMIMILYYSA